MNKIGDIAKEKEELYYTEELNEKDSGRGTDFILRSLLFCLLGFGFACFNGFEDISPFALGFLGAVPFNYCFSSFIGSVLGFFLTAKEYALFKYIGAMVFMCVFRLIMSKRFREKDGSFVSCIISFCLMLGTGLLYLWLTDLYIISLIKLVFESVLTLTSGYFFTVSFRTPKLKGSFFSLEKKNVFCIAVSLCVTLMCLSCLNFQGISPGRIFASVLVMFIGIYKGVGAAAVSGILSGAFLCLSPEGAYLFPAFILSSLAAGILCETGQVVISLSYAAIFTVVSVVCSDIAESWLSLSEPVIASAVFLMIPASKISDLEELFDKFAFTPKNFTDIAVSDTLRSAADNIYDVSQIVTQVSDKLDKIINPEVNRLFSLLQQRVCDGCEKKANCWNKDFDMTASDILSIVGVEQNKEGKIGLAVTCKRYDILCNTVSAAYPSYSAAMASKNKVSEMRRILTDQFIGMSDFLNELSVNVCESRTRDKGKSVYLKTALRDSGIKVQKLDCFCCKGRVTVEISFYDQPDNPSVKKLKPILEFITKRFYEEPEIYPKDTETFIVFKEKAVYKIISGYAQRSLKAGNLCGDTAKIFTSNFNFFNALISDGMGTGSRAAIDSTMTASIVEKLICSDFSFKSALRLVNCALIMKSTDESISTLDAVQINPYNGLACFYKAGGAISFIRQGDSITVIEKASLPMGIIRNITVVTEERRLKRGDIVLLVSDGVTSQDCGWINDELLAWSKSDMQALASHIASLARLRSDKGSRDDISVVAIRVDRGE